MISRDDLIESAESGNLLPTILNSLKADQSDRQEFFSQLVRLHNDGLVNVIEVFAELAKTFEGYDFFRLKGVFEKVLPNLDAPVLPVMQCVIKIYHKAGQDLSAGFIVNAFIDFCVTDFSRPHDALIEIMLNPDQFADLLPPTLIAGSRLDIAFYSAKAISLCEDKNIELRKQAVFSIGKLLWQENTTLLDSALAALEHCVETETDDQVLGAIVKSGFAVFQCEKDKEPQVIKLIEGALTKGNFFTLHMLSEVFIYIDEFSPKLLDLFFLHLVKVKPENKGTLDNIDFGVSCLLKKNDPEKVIRFLEDMLIKHSEGLTMEIFKNTCGEIYGNKVLFSKILTRWFLKGERVLCEAVFTIIRSNNTKGRSLEIDPSEINLDNFIHIVFVARKAVGYFFMQPIGAASVIISLMQHTSDDDVLKNLGDLLFDPLLLNYTGSAKDYVLEQAGIKTGKVKAILEQVLKRIDEYLEDLNSVGELPALHPGEVQREAYHRHFSSIMADSWKEAQKELVLFNLISKSVLLYGKKSISYVRHGNVATQRIETPLKKQSAEIEVPRMEIIDQVGLDYQLRVLKYERLKA